MWRKTIAFWAMPAMFELKLECTVGGGGKESGKTFSFNYPTSTRLLPFEFRSTSWQKFLPKLPLL